MSAVKTKQKQIKEHPAEKCLRCSRYNKHSSRGTSAGHTFCSFGNPQYSAEDTNFREGMEVRGNLPAVGPWSLCLSSINIPHVNCLSGSTFLCTLRHNWNTNKHIYVFKKTCWIKYCRTLNHSQVMSLWWQQSRWMLCVRVWSSAATEHNVRFMWVAVETL